jgi:hypothetical protein
MYSPWLCTDCRCCGAENAETDDEFGDTRYDAPESSRFQITAPVHTAPSQWADLGDSTVTVPFKAAGTELSHLRHTPDSVPAATAAHKSRQVRNQPRPDTGNSSVKIAASPQSSTARKSGSGQVTHVPELYDPSLYSQTQPRPSHRTARLPKNIQGSEAHRGERRPYTKTPSAEMDPQPRRTITDRPDSEVLGGNIRFDGVGGSGQGERREFGGLSRESNNRESFGAYFGKEPLPELPVISGPGSLQQSSFDGSRHALPDLGGRVQNSNNLSATPSPGGHTPELPSPARLNTPPPGNT